MSFVTSLLAKACQDWAVLALQFTKAVTRPADVTEQKQFAQDRTARRKKAKAVCPTDR
jgi:hypothetical protein